MPTYVYEVINADGSPGERFELMQRITEDALSKHPQTGRPVRRVITAAFVAGSSSTMAIERKIKDDKQLDAMGFTKYVKAGDGYYEKRAGKGPDVISRDG